MNPFASFTVGVVAFLLPLVASAATFITPAPGGNETWNQTWTKENSPYVVNGSIYVRLGSLTIKSGVVVKFMAGSSIKFNGIVPVSIEGTAEEPVYFTSFRDDSVGGDTNGDGNATAPAPGDWGFVSLGEGSTHGNLPIAHLKVRYGGGAPRSTIRYGNIFPALALEYPWYTIGFPKEYSLETIEVSHSAKVGLYAWVGHPHTLTIASSSFYGNGTLGLLRDGANNAAEFYGAGKLDARENWWGDTSGPYHPSLNPDGLGNAIDPKISVYGAVLFDPWLAENPLPDPPPAPPYAECCSSVVFLPGIKGSVLKTGLKTLWPPTVFSSDVAQLALDEAGESVNDVYVDGILNTFYGTPIYSPFSSFMDGIVADGLIHEWLPIPYDWRFSPEKILAEGVKMPGGTMDLMQEIETLAAQSQTGQVSIVAHSMGGLLGKVIIKTLEAEGKEGIIDSFVMIGTPQLGTPQAAAALLHGDDEGIVAGLIVRPAAARTIAQNMPSAYNLLPSPRYFAEVSDPIISFDPSSLFTHSWIEQWGNFINSYSDFFSFATGNDVPRENPPEHFLHAPEVLRPELMGAAADLHDEYDSYVFPEHIRVVQVAGWGRPTTKAIEYRESHSTPSYRIISTTEGDKTVVYSSATPVNLAETYFLNLSLFNQSESQNAQHRDLLNTMPMQDMIRNVIGENSILETNYVSETKPPLTETDTRLIVSVHSPVVLGAYDEFGNFTGIDPTQDLSAEILFITENIPDSAFLYSGESQHIFLPKSGTYRFVYKGIEEGPTTVEIANFVADVTEPLASYTDIPTTPGTIAEFTLDSEAPEETAIEIDVNGDGEIDLIVTPDGTELSLNELLALLEEKIQALDVKDKLKKDLLKKIDDLEEKIDKKKKKNAKTLSKLEKKITKEEAKGKIGAADAKEILELLDLLEVQAEDVILDAEVLALLKEKIRSLDIKKGLKNDLLKRVKKLEKKRELVKALSNLTKKVSNQGEKGNIDDADAQEILDLLKQIESAL